VEGVVGVDALLYRRAVKAPALAAYLDTHANWQGVRAARRVLALARPHVVSPMGSALKC
jgi:hypothetical protein